jgi:hypothetical protein
MLDQGLDLKVGEPVWDDHTKGFVDPLGKVRNLAFQLGQ